MRVRKKALVLKHAVNLCGLVSLKNELMNSASLLERALRST
jgi:hypothetical protein